jgi:hypothetical protein
MKFVIDILSFSFYIYFTEAHPNESDRRKSAIISSKGAEPKDRFAPFCV